MTTFGNELPRTKIFTSEPLRIWQHLWKANVATQTRACADSAYEAFTSQRVKRFLASGNGLVKARRKYVEELVAESAKRLAPFGEPLSLDLGMNRWLASEREEAWSNWFAWFFAHLTVDEVAHLFGIESWLEVPDRHTAVRRVSREYWVKSGHEGATGRLDLLIEFSGRQALVVEIKRGRSEDADTEKQEGYFKAMEEKKGLKCKYFLLTTDENLLGEKDRFELLYYGELCLSLRKSIEAFIKKDRHTHTFLALGLALVGAIESCLLNFSIADGFASDTTIDHLLRFLESPNECFK